VGWLVLQRIVAGLLVLSRSPQSSLPLHHAHCLSLTDHPHGLMSSLLSALPTSYLLRKNKRKKKWDQTWTPSHSSLLRRLLLTSAVPSRGYHVFKLRLLHLHPHPLDFQDLFQGTINLRGSLVGALIGFSCCSFSQTSHVSLSCFLPLQFAEVGQRCFLMKLAFSGF
jgi:hypothetical protein